MQNIRLLIFPARTQIKQTIDSNAVIMGRRIPPHRTNNHNLLFMHLHPLLRFSFLAATVAASIVIITALCGVRSRKKPSPPSLSDYLRTADDAEFPRANDEAENQNDESQSDELPPPSAVRQPEECRSTSSIEKESSKRRLSFSLSLKKVHRSLSVSKSSDTKEDARKKEKLLKPEESVWMKTIILGEKCGPDEEESAVIYEGKGKKISAYHPRNSSSFSISKQMSSIDHQDIHSDSNIQQQHASQNNV